MPNTNSKPAYGIDFGTTNSTISVVGATGKPLKLKIDPEAPNPAVMRSVIYVSPQMKFLFGKPAVDAYITDVALGKGSKKKIIETGRMIKLAQPASASGFVADKWVPEIIEIEESEGGRLLQALKSNLSNEQISTINLFGEPKPLEWVVGQFLKEMKERADEILKTKIDKVVLGRPVEYVGSNNELAVKRMRKAAQIAGFNEIEFEYEPVGAAYDYGVEIRTNQIALIYDFGGGTLDISVFKFPEKKVLANVGLPIGGDHFNTEIFMSKLSKYFGSEAKYGMKQLDLPRYIFDSLQNWYQISLLKTKSFADDLESFRFMCSNIVALNSLKSLIFNNLGFGLYEEIERVKKELSIKGSEIYRFNATDIEITKAITRLAFEEIIQNDLIDIEKTLNKALTLAGIKINDVDVVATTGGSSLVPVIHNQLIEMFGKEKIKESDAFTSVAAGLAIRANEIYSDS